MKLTTRDANGIRKVVADDDTPFMDRNGDTLTIRLLSGKYRDKPYNLVITAMELARITDLCNLHNSSKGEIK